MRLTPVRIASQSGFATPTSVVCVSLMCLGLILTGLYQGRGALLYILAGMLIGVMVGIFLSYLWRHLLESYPQLAKKLQYRLVRTDEPKQYESDVGEEHECPVIAEENQESATRKQQFDEIIAHMYELREDPQAYENYEREIENTTKLRAEYGGRVQVRKDRIMMQASLIEDIWQNCFKLSPYFSFIHDRSRIAAWESLAGGKFALIAAIKKRYGANIADVYDEALPIVLNKIANARKTLG